MNIEIANRLVKLRKSNHLSQEALAEKLGISRQAVSKWERAEASPDTDNLILLSKLYHVSLDELLKTEEDMEPEENRSPEIQAEEPEIFTEENEDTKIPAKEESGDRGEEYVNIGLGGVHVKDRDGSEVHIGWDGIHVDDKKKEENVHIDKKGVFINGKKYEGWKFSHVWKFPLSTFICIFYVVIGILFDAWHPGWLLFLLIPIWYSFAEAVRKENAVVFAYPVLVTFVFMCAGFFFNAWHPAWVLYLTVPLYYSIAPRLGGDE